MKILTPRLVELKREWYALGADNFPLEREKLTTVVDFLVPGL